MTTRCTLRKKLAHGDAQGDDQGCDTQRLVSQTMGRPFVAEGGFGLGCKPREVLAMWDNPPLPSPHKAVDKQQQLSTEFKRLGVSETRSKFCLGVWDFRPRLGWCGTLKWPFN